MRLGWSVMNTVLYIVEATVSRFAKWNRSEVIFLLIFRFIIGRATNHRQQKILVTKTQAFCNRRHLAMAKLAKAKCITRGFTRNLADLWRRLHAVSSMQSPMWARNLTDISKRIMAWMA